MYPSASSSVTIRRIKTQKANSFIQTNNDLYSPTQSPHIFTPSNTKNSNFSLLKTPFLIRRTSSMEFTLQQLKQYDGTDPSKSVYVAIKGRVFDVSTGKNFYGPGGAYAMFAGKDASRALAKMSKNEDDVVSNIDGLSDKELEVLADWEKKFEAKYPVVGRVV
ncbi:probable steroid-binding protein 3 [Chenopodium quinoa]|uniref:probable steroid-binding protein 3 n=1 Tax=Chenopodium quinoa TaxID=63459 RepID=UPI000B786E70|nr:probable steroid-binding protein 3 [Chenopodium quinoa]